ncbi:hypothetical protein [Rhodoferax sp.]|uniref:hypothetical protein n=1 Tax=Rhodoferax sp. TaxID=50421 RepID=UPI001EB2830A|nr:hypothetical protein [Rhodoferax sp.]MBT9508645.1 hypothetical protein [Rhodoferax sp.]
MTTDSRLREPSLWRWAAMGCCGPTRPLSQKNQLVNVCHAAVQLLGLALKHTLILKPGNGPQVGLLARPPAADANFKVAPDRGVIQPLVPVLKVRRRTILGRATATLVASAWYGVAASPVFTQQRGGMSCG